MNDLSRTVRIPSHRTATEEYGTKSISTPVGDSENAETYADRFLAADPVRSNREHADMMFDIDRTLSHQPHLTQPRVWEGNRQANMRQRWIQAGKPSAYSPEGYKTTEDGVNWWDSFFSYIANDTSLANGFETNGRTWKPDIEWVINATNFQKIIDGKYTK